MCGGFSPQTELVDMCPQAQRLLAPCISASLHEIEQRRAWQSRLTRGTPNGFQAQWLGECSGVASGVKRRPRSATPEKRLGSPEPPASLAARDERGHRWNQ